MLFSGVKNSIGTGGVNDDDDIFATKKGLSTTGDHNPAYDLYDHPTSEPEKIFSNSVETFQQRFGLKKDGLMKPGGPTETTLRAETAKVELENAGLPAPSTPVKLKKPIGLNQPNKVDDLTAVQSAFNSISKPGIGLNALAGTPPTLETFQSNFGLKPDGIMQPGGPTEATINRLAGPIQAVAHLSPAPPEQAPASPTQLASVSPNPSLTPPRSGPPAFKPPAKPTPPHRTKEERLFGDIDVNFVYKEEGDKLSMYVPTYKNGVVIGKSGATIAKGVDLGQMNGDDLKVLVRSHGLSPALAAKLHPYLGHQKDAAARFVKANPLTITPAEAREITLAKYSSIKQTLQRHFDREMESSGQRTRFEDLDPEHKTALFSFAVQYGPNFKDKPTHRPVWDAATSLNVLKFADALEKYTDFDDRRNREAALARSSNYGGN